MMPMRTNKALQAMDWGCFLSLGIQHDRDSSYGVLEAMDHRNRSWLVVTGT